MTGEGAASPLLAGGIEGGLSHIHDACLILLYRLLFLFYAESRGLLPLDNPSYRQQYSLKAIKEDIAAKLDAGVVFLPRRATLWDDLKALFGIIYEGNQALGVPAYNGGLFDSTKHPFLEERAIGDRYLAQTIDLLARAETGHGLSFVDYRDLEIRHLGSIYEGLLEYRPRMADDGLRVELATERGERKATGSYYTPDYIVKYIVEQTLGPLADAQAEAVEKEVEALKARNRGAARRTPAYKDELARLQNSFADRVLALNVLDPAMGSGHFLVEATDYLARRIVEAGVVSETLTDGDEESELSYWRRRVVERCIYGVDLNPLAVELAKLSLWLATVAKGKPLSFLDHHLRCGNSLIGARVADLQALPVRKKTLRVSEAAQLALWDEGAFTQDMFRVVGAMQQIQEYESADLVTVQEKERLFAETVERERCKWRDIADLWTATYFGLELTPELYNACVQYAQGKPVLLQAAQAEALLAQAHQIWQEKHFFHWEIEFPEVFFDQHGRYKGEAAGFDAVVGNPPYGVIQDKIQKWLIEEHFVSFQGNLENYCFFIETFYQLARKGGRVGYITPLTWLHIPQFRNLRRMVLEWEVDSIVSLPTKVFGDADLDTVIGIGKKAQVAEDSAVKVRRVQIASPEGIANSDTKSIPQMVWCSDTDKKIDLSYDEQAEKLLRKVERESISLAEICRVSQGLVPYAREEFYRVYSKEEADRIVDTRAWHADHQMDETFRKELRGENVSRYEVVWNGRQWIKYGKWLARPRTPEFFTEPRLLIREITRGDRLNAGFTDEELYNNPGIINVILSTQQYALAYLLAIINSALMFYYHRYRSPKARLVTSIPKILVEDVECLPIRRISFTTPAEERARLVGDGTTEATEWIEGTEGAASVSFSVFSASVFGRWLEARLSAEPEQSDVVHDLLAHLAERMIEMHQQKQAEVKGFLGWLADYTGLPVDDWTLKSNLRRYYEHDWAGPALSEVEGMQRILQRNQRKLPNVDLDVDAYRNEPAQKIKAAWETSMDTLRPLLARIAATDRLIDLIVYRLYGLSENETTVIEGN